METPLDYKTLVPIPYKKTVSLLNNFVINTTEFLNKFSFLCEEKLNKVTTDIERLEITMNILEAKLASIPGLEAGAEVQPSEEIPTGPAVSTYQPPQEQNGFESEEEKEDSADESGPPPPPPGPSESQDGKMKVKDDPRYKQYFTLIRLGAPIAQIKMQMKAQKLDPNILDDPEAEAPPAINGHREVETESKRQEEEEEAPQPPPPPPLVHMNGNSKDNESGESESEEEN